MVFPEFLTLAADLPKETKSKLFKVLRQLSTDHRHPGLQTKKIQGTKADVFECRVDDSIRLIYDLAETSLRCWFVGAHDTALKFGVRMGSISRKDHLDDIEATQIPSYVTILTKYLQSGEVEGSFVQFHPSD
jgi:mRNA-degrading endonuclease YafQ of YafQ-DinJ toxin-antitoxin module